MNKASSVAPGKLMLAGEHAVVYGYPCLITSINKKISVTIQKIEGQNIKLTGNSIFVKTAVLMFFQKFGIKSRLSISTSSEFPKVSGLGSSSAVTVATLKSLSKLFHIPLADSSLFNLSFEVVLKVQGVSSGFDIASAIYKGVIYYQKNKPVVKLPDKKMPLLVVYSGNKGNTVKMIDAVAKFRKENKEKSKHLFAEISEIVKKSKLAYLKSNWQDLGRLFNKNQKYLKDLGVSTAKINILIDIANQNGAYGAKLSGAGGGDCLIVLHRPDNKEKLISALQKNGGEILDVL